MMRHFVLLFAAATASALGQDATALPPPAENLGRLNPLAQRVDWSGLSAFHRVLTLAEFEKAFANFYAGGRQLPPPWTVATDKLLVKTGDSTMPVTTVDFRKDTDVPVQPTRYWRTVDELPALEGKPVLSGLRIALDPGHIGGDFAAMEERHLSFKDGEHVREGESTLIVAQQMQKTLEKLGAQVFLVRSRNEPVTTARAPDFRAEAQATLLAAGIPTPVESYAGLTGDAKIMTLQWQMEKLFYRVSEIRARAVRVNTQLRPDLVICLHLNAEPWGPEGARVFSQRNHFHVLINGTYSPDELMLQDERYEMLQRLFNKVHEQELPLAESVAKSVASTTSLPPFEYVTGNAARKVGSTGYVWARNLLANRLYQCPVIYLEPYVMNHEETYRRLLMGEYRGRTLVNGKLQRSITTDYADGVVKGLVSYYKEKRKP